MPSDYTIARAGIDQLPEFMALISGAGWPHRTTDVAPMLRVGCPLRALDAVSGETLGIAVWWPMGPEAARVGLVVVAPEAKGQGIGRALMDKVLEEAGRRTLILLATEEGRPLYQKLGFESIGLCQRHQGHYQVAPAKDNRIAPARREDHAEILVLDRQMFGADRAPMLTHLLEAGTATVLRSSEKITGYAVFRPFGRGHVLGPVIAENEEDALALFSATAEPGLLRVDRALTAERFGAHLAAFGIVGEEITHAMALGQLQDVGNSNAVFAMASHAWG